MDEPLRALLESINGLRTELRASTVAQERLTRLMADVFRDFTAELREIRYQRERLERLEARVENFVVLAGGVQR
jgi:hypothetical protein